MNFLKGLLMVCLLVLQACHYKHLKDQADDNSDNAELSDVVQIDFVLVKKNIIQPRCLECHVPGGSAGFLPLETYQQVKQSIADIKATIADDSMPKNRAPLTISQKQILNSWIEAGAPETVAANPAPKPSPTNPPAPSEPPAEPPTQEPVPTEPAKDWLTVKTLVLDPACLRCHSAPANRAGINVETYQNVIRDISIIETVIQDGSMPIRGSLTPEQKKLILEWIQAGAPEFVAP